MSSHGAHSRASAGSISAEAHAHALRLCREWDVDNDGAISRKELATALRQIFPDCSEDDVESVMQAVDVNKDGLMQYTEVLDWLSLRPHEKRCFEDSLRSYIHGTAAVAQPLVAGSKLWDEKFLQGFVHPLMGRFSVRAEPVASASAPAEAVKVRLLARGVRASDGEAACTVVLRRDASGGQLIDARVRAADYVGDGVQRLLTTLRHYAEVHLCILEAFCSTIAATDKPPVKPACLRFEPMPVIGRDSREIPPVPQAFWSATAVALARLSPVRQRKLAHAHVYLCVGGNGASLEFQAVLDAKVQAASSAVGSPSFGEVALPQRRGSYNWVRQDNDPEARLCRLQSFLLTQRAAWAGGYEAAVVADKPGKAVGLTQVERMLQGTSVRLAELDYSNVPPEPMAARPTELRSLTDLGLPERSTAMEVASALATKGKKVAAVNAASAYSVGGGCSSGGRHALEEAWCTTSTLFRSLAAAKAADLVEPLARGSAFPPQHVPTLGCVVSPAVEVFREGTDKGYKLLPQPVCLCGVLSVAMFNRNPSVADSPLDCPEDPTTYVAQTQAKLESVVLAAADLGADVLVVPDVGCGVFQNDALVVGGCLGNVLRRRSGRLREVVTLQGVHRGFAEACRRTFRGEDPREACPAGASCGQRISDPVHAARMLHGSERLDVDTALVVLASNPEEIQKPMCRYGALCRIKKPEHLGRFLHPPPSDTIPWSRVVEEAERNPASMECPPYAPPPDKAPIKPEEAELPRPVAAAAPRSAPAASSAAAPAEAAEPPPQALARAAAAVPAPPALRPSGASAPDKMIGSVGTNVDRPVCRYGEACYNKNPKHLKDFAHPWLEGTDTPEQSKERGDTASVHEMLTLGKAGKWPEVQAILRKRPGLVNGRPDCRSFGLVHHAAWQIRMDEMESLVLDFRADLAARTKEGKTAEDVLNESVQLGGLTAAESARAVALQSWLRRRGGGQSEASPASGAVASRANAAAAPPAVSPAVVNALGGAMAGAAAASSSCQPEPKPRGAVLTVSSCLNMRLEGDYAEVAQAHNGFPAYWKAATSATGGQSGHYIYYNFRTSLGWVIDSDLSDFNEPLAYLGSSQCGADPSAKAYGEAWKVHCVNKIAGGYYSRDTMMRIKRR